jgi:hypothetical protein
MKRVLLVWAASAFAAVTFGSTVDRGPGCPAATTKQGPTPYNPVWGECLRFWPMWEALWSNMAACTNDGYFLTGQYGSFDRFYVYTTMGSYVRSVRASGVLGTCDGTGKTHLGSGYFASITPADTGVSFWRYSAGGYPGSVPTISWPHLRGRGISWDGKYYYVSNFNTPIFKVNSSGSVVGTVPGSPWDCALYGHATPVRPGGNAPYIYVTCHKNEWLAEHSLRTGVRVRSFSVYKCSGGLDIGWDDGYLYYVQQTTPCRWAIVYDGDFPTSVKPTSLGKVKAVFR